MNTDDAERPPLPPSFPPLPGQHNWSANVILAANILCDAYTRAHSVLHQEAEAIRLKYHIDAITNDFMPLLESMEGTHEEENIPLEWLDAAATTFGLLVVYLQSAYHGVDQRDPSNVVQVEPLTIYRTGKKGRPRKIPNLEFIKEAMSPNRNINVSELARLLGIDRHTLKFYLHAYDVDRKFSGMSDQDLDLLVRTFKTDRPEAGIRYVIGFLRNHGLRIQKTRVIHSVRRVDGLGREIRRRTTINRREYKNPRPNALWHCDGHHKLIRWGIVVHGFVDGYCRTVTGLKASTNNRAETVLDVFTEAIGEYGTPSRVRGDRGGENVEVSVWMILKRGPNRASFMWGSSTHNTRIERLWVEVGRNFGRGWRAFFTRLERLHRLDASNGSHLWLLHFLFLVSINRDCKRFQDEWNCHPISGNSTNDQSPNDLRFKGLAKEGVYADDFEGIHPDLLQEFFGTTRRHVPRRAHQTGAGNDVKEEDSDVDEDELTEDEIRIQVSETQAQQVLHPPVDVPLGETPFQSDDELTQFLELYHEAVEQNFVPDGYGVLHNEWDDGEYPGIELLKTGRRRRELAIHLPDTVWRPRAETWAQGLHCMMYVLFQRPEMQ